MERKKVYCKDCISMRYIINHDPCFNAGFYGCVLSKFSPFTPWASCDVKNKNGDCIDYKRKWWKFWVKEVKWIN